MKHIFIMTDCPCMNQERNCQNRCQHKKDASSQDSPPENYRLIMNRLSSIFKASLTVF